jgi:hypothetical protein
MGPSALDPNQPSDPNLARDGTLGEQLSGRADKPRRRADTAARVFLRHRGRAAGRLVGCGEMQFTLGPLFIAVQRGFMALGNQWIEFSFGCGYHAGIVTVALQQIQSGQVIVGHADLELSAT